MQALADAETSPRTSASETRVDLLERLVVAFRHYGPSRDEGYTDDALYHALGAMLVQVGLEKPDPLRTVAHRLYSFLTDHRPHLKSRRPRRPR
jgi:hypothetical protein